MVDQLKSIIKGCIAGKRSCQEELYRIFSGKMFGLCLQYASSYEDAKDIMQEGFIKVFGKLKQYDGRGSFEGWIRRIMINTALEKYRSQLFMYPVNQVKMDRDEFQYEHIIEKLTAKDLIRMVQSLPPRYRMVFNMYAIEGYSHREIGKIMGISTGTSKSNLSRARGILQEKVRKLFNSSENNIIG